MLRSFWVRVVVYLLPAILIAYGDRQFDLKFFEDVAKQKLLESICFIIGIISTTVLFPIVIEGQKTQIRHQKKMLKKIYQNFRDALNKEMSEYFMKDDIRINIRIFLPQKGLKAYLAKIFKKELYFEIHNLDGLFVEEVENLAFQVSPKPQGLVGLCYHDNIIWHDFHLKDNHKMKEYNLKMSQIQKTDYCQFAIAAPIYKDNDSIDSIITFDSTVQVDEPKDNSWEVIIKQACKTIYLCKPLINYKSINYE